MKTNETQCNLILNHLKNGLSINPIQALKMFGCFRLGARIYDLKRRYPELNIVSERVEKKGKYFSCYFIKP
jgi:hypothetical protein